MKKVKLILLAFGVALIASFHIHLNAITESNELRIENIDVLTQGEGMDLTVSCFDFGSLDCPKSVQKVKLVF